MVTDVGEVKTPILYNIAGISPSSGIEKLERIGTKEEKYLMEEEVIKKYKETIDYNPLKIGNNIS